MKRYERRLGVKKGPKAEADRRYYIKNRQHILEKAKKRREEAERLSLLEPKMAKSESPESPKELVLATSLFRQWIQWVIGKKDSQTDTHKSD